MSDFDKYAEKLRTREDLIKEVSDEQKLDIYALFKQGSIGDVNTARPGMMTMSFTATMFSFANRCLSCSRDSAGGLFFVCSLLQNLDLEMKYSATGTHRKNIAIETTPNT